MFSFNINKTKVDKTEPKKTTKKMDNISSKKLGNNNQDKPFVKNNLINVNLKSSIKSDNSENKTTTLQDSSYSIDNLKAVWVGKENEIITAKLYGDIDYSEETAILTEVEDDVNPKSNFMAARPPNETDDVTEGYAPNSLWVDYTREPAQVYRCISNDEDNAEWVRVPVDVRLSYAVLEEWLENKDATWAHTHDNKSILDNITDSGSGQIITQEERDKLQNINDDGFDLSKNTTDDLSEGENNLYYKDGYVDSHLSGGSGINYDFGTIDNTDTGSDAVSSHESTYNHNNYLTDITSESIRDLSDVQDTAPSDGQTLVWNDTESRYEPSTISSDNYYLDGVSGDGNSDVTFTMNGTSDITQDFSHTHTESEISDLSHYTDSDVDSHLSGGTGISYDSGTIDNTDTGSDAVSSHESDYNHDNYLTNITSESIRDLSDVQDTAPSDGQALVWNDTESRYEPSTLDYYDSSDFDSDFSGKSTDDLSEGSNNLYHTDTRAADAAPVQEVAGKTGSVSLDKSDVGLDNVPNKDATDPANWDSDNTDGNFLVGDGSTFVTESGSTARDSLGLGSAATSNDSDFASSDHDHDSTYLNESNNLSDLDSASTARSNLGLGSAAERDYTISSSDPSGGSDGDVWYKVS